MYLTKTCLKNMIRLYVMIHPTMTAGRILTIWDRSALWKEYKKPDLATLEQVIRELRNE